MTSVMLLVECSMFHGCSVLISVYPPMASTIAWLRCSCSDLRLRLFDFFQLMVSSTMFIYQSAVKNFLPMPSKSHYVFNLRDFARVIRGVLLVPPSQLEETDMLIRLWIHEVYRVFSDRLTEVSDRFATFSVYDTQTRSPPISVAKRNAAPLNLKFAANNMAACDWFKA